VPSFCRFTADALVPITAICHRHFRTSKCPSSAAALHVLSSNRQQVNTSHLQPFALSHFSTSKWRPSAPRSTGSHSPSPTAAPRGASAAPYT